MREFFSRREQLKTAETPSVILIDLRNSIENLRKKAASKEENSLWKL
jgi:hypothetical protein